MPPETNLKKTLIVLLGFAVSGLLIWRFYQQTDWAVAWQAVKGVNVPLLLLSVVIATSTFPLRIPRWRLLLPEGAHGPLRTSTLWHAINIGFTANNLIPLRVGEVVRAATVTRLEQVPFATTFASLAVERVIDGVFLIGLLSIGLVTADLPPDLTLANGVPIAPYVIRTGVFFLVAILIAVAAAWRPDVAMGLLRKVIPGLGFGEKLLHFVERMLTGLAALHDPRRAIPVLVWSLALWLVNAGAFWLGMIAFGIHLPYVAALVLQGLLVVAVALPLSPGSAGGYETAIVLSLGLFKVNESIAAAYAVAFHVTTLIPLLLLGLISVKQIGGSFTTTQGADIS